MGYLNPFLAYGLDDLVKEAQEAGKSGYIVQIIVGIDRFWLILMICS